MSELFCTPEQGAKIKELLPEVKSAFCYSLSELTGNYHIRQCDAILTTTPALTLQELRDEYSTWAWGEKLPEYYSVMLDEFLHSVAGMTAPELADWVIARLEEAK